MTSTSASSTVGVGGVVGAASSGTVSNCYNTGDVTGKGNSSIAYVGGVVGNSSGAITNCYNIGDVTGTSASNNANVGGVVGYSSGAIINCYNTGSVSGTSASNNANVGGVVGYNYNGTVSNCYNTGDVTGTSDSSNAYVGGVVGYSTGAIINCYNTGSVSGTSASNNANVGGVVGYNYNGTVSNCYAYEGITVTGSTGTTLIDTTNLIGSDNNSSATSNVTTFDSSGDLPSETITDGTTEEVYYSTLLSALNAYVDENTSDDLPLTSWLSADGDDVGEAFAEFKPSNWADNYDIGWYEANPSATEFEIDSAEELAGLASLVNAGTDTFIGDTITLTSNIDLSAHEWTAIGTNSTIESFQGTFDGGGNTISGLYINQSSSKYQGLFGYVGEGGVVENLGVSGSVTGSSNVGGVVGYNKGTVSNCYNTGSVTGGNPTGGVVGQNNGAVSNCYNTGTVTGTQNVGGGVVGNNYFGTVSNCYNTGAVTGTTYVGGVVGFNSVTVSNCYNTGDVAGSSNVGGVVGNNSNNGTVSNCYAFSGITVNSSPVASDTLIGSGSGAISNVTTFDSSGDLDASNGYSYEGCTTLLSALNAYVDENTSDDLPLASWLSADGTDGVYATFAPTTNWADNYDIEWYDSSATEFEIDSAAELAGLAALVNGKTDLFAGDTITLTSNIDLSAHEWTAIGTDSDIESFQGTFDGGNHTISGLYINSTSNYQGLFGFVYNGTVKNLAVSGSVASTLSWVGGVVGGINGGTVENCSFVGSVSGLTYVGGVVGENRSSTVSNCYNAGDVSSTPSSLFAHAGGVVGHNNSGTVLNCYNTGDVSVTETASEICAGGVVGENSGTVSNCYNTGGVSATADAHAGGVVGNNTGTVSNCYAYDGITVTVDGSDIESTADMFLMGDGTAASNVTTFDGSGDLGSTTITVGTIEGVCYSTLVLASTRMWQLMPLCKVGKQT